MRPPPRDDLRLMMPGSLDGERLDKAIAAMPEARARGLDRKLAGTLIMAGKVAIGGRVERFASRRLRAGEVVTIALPPSRPGSAEPGAELIAILYDEGGLLVIDKPAGLPTEPTRDRARANVITALRRQLALAENEFIGVPHRLDRDTSGVLLVARRPEVLATLSRALVERTAHKLYVARVHGRVEADEGRFESFLAPVGTRGGKERWGSVRSGGKKAITRYRVIERSARTTLVECVLETGRTHQARVHLSEAGHPILGDEHYGAPAGEHAALGRHLLHARRIELPHPTRAGETLSVESPLPAIFVDAAR